MTTHPLYEDFEEAWLASGMTPAELARKADTPTAAVRGLLTERNGHNHTLAAVSILAEALGYELRLVPRSPQAVAEAAIHRPEAARAAADLRSLDGGPFSTVLADPPWRFQNRTGKVAPEHRRLSRYETMTTAEVCALPVPEIVTERAHLYLWVPNALIADGLRVMDAWGFTYKSNLVWAKRRKDGGPDGRGVGFYFRNVTELILFGVRGHMRTLDAGRRQVNILETQKREHSRKPDEQYELIEACSHGPHLEMFARYARPGWVSWGLEADNEAAPRASSTPPTAEGPPLRPARAARRSAPIDDVSKG